EIVQETEAELEANTEIEAESGEEVAETFETEEIVEENVEEIPDTEIVETPEVIETSVTEEITKQETPSPIITLADKMGQTLTPSRHEALYKTENSLGNTLGNKKVDDIKQAISIGDRFRFQRELFANNGEDMNKTLNYINQLATFDEAEVFLKSKYRWDDENETATDFLNIVKRKFI
ncbi:MAG: hypothetical protein LBN23_02305, partial [Paludibacter sp.]|nr:hypothetical protein [Paludibacter sp.]